jgi:hypothetical protein
LSASARLSIPGATEVTEEHLVVSYVSQTAIGLAYELGGKVFQT